MFKKFDCFDIYNHSSIWGYKLKGRTCQKFFPFPVWNIFFAPALWTLRDLPVPTEPVFFSFLTLLKISLTLIRKKVGNFQFEQSKNIIDPIFGSWQTISTAYLSLISFSSGEKELMYVGDACLRHRWQNKCEWQFRPFSQKDLLVKMSPNLQYVVNIQIYISFADKVIGKEMSLNVLDSQVKSTDQKSKISKYRFHNYSWHNLSS